MTELQSQHQNWKAARQRIAAAARPPVVELVPPTRDPSADVMDIIVAAVSNAMSIPATEIMRGASAPDTISARRLAMAMCVRHPRFAVERVAEYFEVGQNTVHKAVSILDPILDSYVITRKTRLELSLPLIAKEWCAVESVHRRRPSIEQIISAVAEVFNESVDDIMSKRKGVPLQIARIVAIGLSKNLTLKSYPELGRIFHRDHTAIMYSARRFAPVYEAVKGKISPAATPEMWASMAREELAFTRLLRIKE